jgi:hypothetical protein
MRPAKEQLPEKLSNKPEAIGWRAMPSELTPPIKMHIAARIEDAYTAFRARLSRASGQLPTVVAFRGYGTATSIRILARVL